MRFLHLQGSEGELVGVVDFWVRLFPPAEPTDPLVEPETHRAPVQITLGWQDGSHEVNRDTTMWLWEYKSQQTSHRFFQKKWTYPKKK